MATNAQQMEEYFITFPLATTRLDVLIETHHDIDLSCTNDDLQRKTNKK